MAIFGYVHCTGSLWVHVIIWGNMYVISFLNWKFALSESCPKVCNFFSAPRHSFPGWLSLSPNAIQASLVRRIYFVQTNVVVVAIATIGIGGGSVGDNAIRKNSGGVVTLLIE